jgi:hypothetical protein
MSPFKYILPLPLLCALLLGGCDGGTGPKQEAVELRLFSDSITVGQSARVVGVGDSTLVLISPAKWTSSNPAVATVDEQGIITGKKAGTARIALEAAGRLGQVTLTVLDPLPDAETYAYASVEGQATTCLIRVTDVCAGLGTRPGEPWVKAPVRISCGPGLFGSHTLTDAEGRFRFDLRVPQVVHAELIDGDRLGCLLHIDPFWGEGPDCLTDEGCHISSQRVAVPVVTFVTENSAVVPHRVDIIGKYAGYRPITAVQELLYTMRVGDSVLVPIPTPRSTGRYPDGRPLFPDHTTSSIARMRETIMIKGTAVGTAAVEIIIVDISGARPDTIAVAGAIGIRVTS